MKMKWIENNIFPLVPAFLLVILNVADVKFQLSIKFDTILMVIGNFAIAFYIASAINKRLKNEELQINNCFKELDFLQNLLSEIRKSVFDNNTETQDNITRLMSLIVLQIELIKKYDYIGQIHKDRLFDQYYNLNKNLTDSDTIDQNYKMSLLQLEREILNIKSSIL